MLLAGIVSVADDVGYPVLLALIANTRVAGRGQPMAWPAFLFWNALGGVAWGVSIALVVFFLAARSGSSRRGLGAAIALVGAGLIAWIVLRRRKAAAPVRRRGRS